MDTWPAARPWRRPTSARNKNYLSRRRPKMGVLTALAAAWLALALWCAANDEGWR